MDLPAEAVAEPVAEVVAEAGAGDVVAGGLVDLPSLEALSPLESSLQLGEGGVAGAGDEIEDLPLAGRRLVAYERPSR